MGLLLAWDILVLAFKREWYQVSLPNWLTPSLCFFFPLSPSVCQLLFEVTCLCLPMRTEHVSAPVTAVAATLTIVPGTVKFSKSLLPSPLPVCLCICICVLLYLKVRGQLALFLRSHHLGNLDRISSKMPGWQDREPQRSTSLFPQFQNYKHTQLFPYFFFQELFWGSKSDSLACKASTLQTDELSHFPGPSINIS